MSRSAVICGAAYGPLGKAEGTTAARMQEMAALDALEDAGLKSTDVDAVYTCGTGYLPSIELAERLGVTARSSDSTFIGGASQPMFVQLAAEAIERGDCEVAVVAYGSRQRSEASSPLKRARSDIAASFAGMFEVPIGLPVPLGTYALAADRHMGLFGTTPEQLATVAVEARRWARLNPLATRTDELTVEDVLGSPEICSPLHARDCCLVTDGAGAVVLTTAERAADLPNPPVAVLGGATAHSHSTVLGMPELTETPGRLSAARALSRAGIQISDVDVLELYDSFTITVLLELEDIGLCGKGESGPYVLEGHIGPGGSSPANTSGGGLSFLHPGMFGIFLVIEAVRQLRGQAGSAQVEGAEVALCHGMGGALSAAATLVLGRL